MSSYNYVNGTPASANWDILTGILRNEWGFKGYVSGDWNNNKDHVDEINAGNTVREPASFCDINVVLKAIEKNQISRETLINGAKDSLYVMLRSRKFYDMNRLSICGETHTFDEFGRCTKCNCPDFTKHTELSSIVEKLVNGEQLPEEEVKTKGNVAIPAIIGGVAAGLAGATAAVIVKSKRKKNK